MHGQVDEMITSKRNRRVVEARKLGQRKHRQRRGCFLVEGLQLLHMALDAGARPLEVFYCADLIGNKGAAALMRRFWHADVDTMPVSPCVLGSLSRRDAPQGIVAIFPCFDSAPEDLRLTGGELVLVLDRLQNPGNVGMLVRTADAVGAAAVIMIEPCVDIFDPRAVRGSMGSLFNVPLARTPDVAATFRFLGACGFRLVGADAHNGADWGHGLWGGGVALVLGNEKRGLSEDVRVHLDGRARLPMVGKADSLNVALAGGVLMYTWLRANQ
jgi:TrmH family RNA methyltransferase